jgi:hypothetical protein
MGLETVQFSSVFERAYSTAAVANYRSAREERVNTEKRKE